MPDEQQQSQQGDDQERTEGEQTESGTDAGGDGQGEESDVAKLLKALKSEREARSTAEKRLKDADREKRTAETERAIKAGEIDSVVKAKDAEIADLTQTIADLQAQLKRRDTDLVRQRVGAAHKLPAELIELLQGDDEAAMTTHAKRLAKLVAAPKAPETEAGRGNGQGGKPTVQETAEALRKTGRYASVG